MNPEQPAEAFTSSGAESYSLLEDKDDLGNQAQAYADQVVRFQMQSAIDDARFQQLMTMASFVRQAWLAGYAAGYEAKRISPGNGQPQQEQARAQDQQQPASNAEG